MVLEKMKVLISRCRLFKRYLRIFAVSFFNRLPIVANSNVSDKSVLDFSFFQRPFFSKIIQPICQVRERKSGNRNLLATR